MEQKYINQIFSNACLTETITLYLVCIFLLNNIHSKIGSICHLITVSYETD